MQMKELVGKINALLLLVSTIIPAYFLFKTSPEEITGQAIIVFGVILVTLLTMVFFGYGYSKYKHIINSLDDDKVQIKEIKRYLNFKKTFSDMDVRLRLIEEMIKNKKGEIEINPMIVGWIFIFILLLLFLRQVGFFS